MSILDRLAKRQLVVVTGKGGVGKTTLTAVLGRLLADHGKRVLLLEVDPRESLHQALGTEPSGGEVVRAGPQLSIQNLQPGTVIEGLVREKVPIAYLARKITGSVPFHQFVEGAPGLKETALLGYAYRVLQDGHHPHADLVIVDAPATGHGATMLAAPGLLAQAAEGGQLGDMAAVLAEFLADASRCGVVLATLLEEMPVQETLELIELLGARMDIRPDLIVANGMYPAIPQGATHGTHLWQARRRLNEAELSRLAASWEGPLLKLPLLPLDRGPALVTALVSRLREADP
jgi:energy-coupling factor transporter ATP-binding protein EcfA2